ncbi:MAG: DUF3034 domain-containing protein [Oleiphilus sp.]|nr:MAG: DUF3034 domain-containing protein [Oleiphilus sp.]
MVKVRLKNRITSFVACLMLILAAGDLCAGSGKLLATAGLTQVEGSGGGGIVPWATLAGYDTAQQTSGSVFSTHVGVDDYNLQVWGAAVGLYDRLELSVARQTFDLSNTTLEIRQNIIGAKVRLYGDVVYSQWPQISFGAQRKELKDEAVADLLGAKTTSGGADLYLAATKVHLGLAAGYNLIWNFAIRATKANQLGLLGYGGPNGNSRKYVMEASLGVLLSRQWAFGMEYRQKPDNLSVREEDWKDVFVSYMPNKQFNLTAAWADLGSIANAGTQQGLYISLTGYLW